MKVQTVLALTLVTEVIQNFHVAKENVKNFGKKYLFLLFSRKFIEMQRPVLGQLQTCVNILTVTYGMNLTVIKNMLL